MRTALVREIADHGVGDRALGEHADDVGGARPVFAFKDDRGARAMALEASQHEAQQVDVAADDGALLDEIVDKPTGVVHAFAPEAGFSWRMKVGLANARSGDLATNALNLQ